MVGKGGNKRCTLSISTRAEEGWIEIRIAETGDGIPEAIRDRIFDPFFTTNKVEVGAGQGTTFIIRLPLR